MHLVAVVGLLVLVATFQSVLGSSLAVFGARPDWIMLLVVSWAMLRGFEEGALLGAIGGFLVDVTSGAPFGLYTLVLAVAGTCAAVADAQLVRGNASLLLATAVLATVGYHGAIMLALQALGWHALPAGRFLLLLFPTIVLNLVLLPVAMLVSDKLYRATTGWRQLEV